MTIVTMDNLTLLSKTGLTPQEWVNLTTQGNRMTAWRYFQPGVSTPVWVNLLLRYCVAFPGAVEWLREQHKEQSNG